MPVRWGCHQHFARNRMRQRGGGPAGRRGPHPQDWSLMSDIVFSSATQLAAAIRAGRVSAIEALEAHLAQIDQHNPVLNAVITLDAEPARRRAREADRAMARGEIWGPLHGVPFTLKDAHATAGLRTTTGFPPLA